MKKIITTSLALFLALSTSHAGGKNWLANFEAAKKKAAAENKDLLVDFTGSDWCGWCIRLKKEVFDHDAFNKGVADKFVLVEIDFPQDKSKISKATQKQNEKLSKKYGIQGFPTILLMDAKGHPYARTGYQAGGPKKYVQHLNELRANRKEGLALMALQNKINAKPSDASKIVESYFAKNKVTGEKKQNLLSMTITPLIQSGKFDDAYKALDEIIAAGPKSDMAKAAKNFQPRLREMMKQAKKN